MTSSIPADWLPDNPAPSNTTQAVKLCFQAAASAVAWLSFGATDVLITWKACIGEQAAEAGANGVARGLYFSVTALLLVLAVLAGTMSYRNWKKLSGLTKLLSAEGQESGEFLSLAGLYISFTLSTGMVLLGIPLFILEICVRIR